MSFIYSQALEAAFSEGSCSDTEQSVPLSGNPTHKLSLSHDRTMDASRLSRFGMTCKPLTESRGAELLTWWLEGFPAKTYPLQEKAQGSTELEAECGGTWLGWLAKFDPNSSLWKTAQLSLIGDSGESLATFPRSGMTRGGLLWELQTLERPTNATGYGFWPTPTVCGNYNRKGASKTSGDGLATAVAMSLTKSGLGYSDARIAKGKWSTPTTRQRTSPSQINRNSPGLALEVGAVNGTLNPNWVEWLMGWPIGWTALKQSETAKSRPAPQWLGELLAGFEA